MRRLLPHPADDVTPEQAYAYARHRHSSGRPWVGVCMVASLDGSTVAGGRSGGLSSPTDSAVLHALRSVADVILVGAGTVRAEGYGVPRKPGQRIGVVTRSGNVDLTSELFRSGAGFLVLPENGPLLPDALEATCVRVGVDDVDLPRAVAGLDATFVQAEGGSLLNGQLADADLVDEWNLTISPVIVGGDGPRPARGGPELQRAVELTDLFEEDGFLFTRWRRAAD